MFRDVEVLALEGVFGGWVGLGLLVEWRLVIVIVMLRPAGLGQEKQRKGGCGPERIGGGEEEGQAVEIFF